VHPAARNARAVRYVQLVMSTVELTANALLVTLREFSRTYVAHRHGVYEAALSLRSGSPELLVVVDVAGPRVDIPAVYGAAEIPVRIRLGSPGHTLSGA
jgi:hypothetical protein